MSAGVTASVGLALRRMCAQDLDQVEAIEAAAFAKPWTRESFRHELELPFSVALVAHPEGDPGEIAGYVVCWRIADEVHLLDLAVDGRFRRRGVGALLTAAILEVAVDAAARLVSLEVAESNHAARALYDAAGFAPVQTRRDYYGPGAHAVVMEWRAETPPNTA